MKLLMFKVLLLMMTFVSGEVFQNSTGLCESQCKCNSNGKNYNIDCRTKGMINVLANWPEPPKNSNTIIGMFTRNNITNLKAFPPTNLSLVVYFDHCGIAELDTGLMENCIQIKHLDLSYNSIKANQLHSDVFKGPYNNSVYEPIALEHLDLSYNKIHSLEQNLFEHLPNLKYLNLEGNHFRIFDKPSVKSFQNLNQLQQLFFGENRFLYIPEEAMKPLTELIILDLSGNIFDFVPNSLVHLKKLKKLSVDRNPIIEFTDQTFVGLDSLEEISAADLKQMMFIKTNSFMPLKNLRKINLSGMNVTNIEDEAFGDIRHIRELNLSNCNLQSLPVKLVDWSVLNVLDLKKNNFYCECDLFNITTRLSADIKRDKEGPYCHDFKSEKQYEVYSLGSDVCFEQDNILNWSGDGSSSDMRIIRTSLIMLSILLIMSVVVAFWLAYNKLVLYKRNRSYPFASSVMYNPILTNN
ncbi:PREDICTED: chondroadherin-like protein [Nicrophorus vespilloides]|uniref:Chondroadherin-like protein n=1 Tax=Nicrophorus vespilloides TaxID=110193 RepID=A0ABM1M5S4_NICVS|nr:PREDICTED: chondroadherin-like protein [Nicrophorus vespilloides]